MSTAEPRDHAPLIVSVTTMTQTKPGNWLWWPAEALDVEDMEDLVDRMVAEGGFLFQRLETAKQDDGTLRVTNRIPTFLGLGGIFQITPLHPSFGNHLRLRG
jgi:hypothetical protein